MKHRVCLVTNYLSAGGLERVLTRLATYFVEKKEVLPLAVRPLHFHI